jgi:hypothetical protein
MRAAESVTLNFRGRPQFLFDCLTARRQFRGRWAPDKEAFDDRTFWCFRRCRCHKELHNIKFG